MVYLCKLSQVPGLPYSWNPLSEAQGFGPGVTGDLVVGREQWCISVNSARVDQAVNRYLEKSGESKQEGNATEQDGWPRVPPPQLHLVAEGL